VELAAALLDGLGVRRCHWVGTSMGGAIGMLGAATTLRGRIERLVLNDHGPQIAAAAVERIRAYAGSPPAFATVGELERYFRSTYAPFGWLSDGQWRRLTETSLRRLPDGRVTPHYDPAVALQLVDHPEDYDLWAAWDRLDLPVLCLRGALSDLLLAETAAQMRIRGPRARVVELPGVGHAPALNTPEQLTLIEAFLGGA
jgi:pimeloyl-ACP methyl ester carboxylesterase